MWYLARRFLLSVMVSVFLFPAAPAFSADRRGAAAPKASHSWGAYQSDHDVLFDNRQDAGEIADLHELTRHLLRSAAQLSKYRMPEASPMVTRVSRAALEARACSSGVGKCGVSAMYQPELGILMAEDLKPETNLFQRSILLHEMVHYLQDIGQELVAASPCERWYQRELEAYAVQKQYLVSINSLDRVAYSGSRPTCETSPDAQTHRAKVVRAPTVND